MKETIHQFLSKRPTPKGLKFLIYITLFVQLFALIAPEVIPHLGLSVATLKKGFTWQPLTYLFLPTESHFSFSFLIQTAFAFYFLWFFGSALIERITPWKFFFLYFASGIIAGLFSIWVASLLHQDTFFLMGNSASLLAMIMTWNLLNPKATIFLFFVIPFRMGQFLLFVIGGILFLYLIHGDWIHLSYNMAGVIFGVLFTILFFQSPKALWKKYKHLFSRKKKVEIYDFATGKQIKRDELFLEEMLTKISKQGEKSLSFWEKRKMKKILKSRKN
ncbi:MAG: rhomboid family intramembrane serine protease [Chlamydiota bacterium]